MNGCSGSSTTLGNARGRHERVDLEFREARRREQEQVGEQVVESPAVATDDRDPDGATRARRFERSYEAAAAHWNIYRTRLAELISVSQLAMVNDDFAEYWTDLCALPTALITATIERAQRHGYCVDDDPKLTAIALVSMLNQFCYTQLSGDGTADAVDDEACITTLANVFYRTIYHKETAAT